MKAPRVYFNDYDHFHDTEKPHEWDPKMRVVHSEDENPNWDAYKNKHWID